MCVYTGSESTCNFITLTNTKECYCPGDTLIYECSIAGGGVTVWKGTAFDCHDQRNEVSFLHSRFNGSLRCSGADRELVARTLSVESNCYSSQLNVTVSSNLNGTSVKCVYDNGTDEIEIGSENVNIIGKVLLYSDSKWYPSYV